MNVNEVAETPVGVTAMPPMVAVMPAVNPLPVTVTVWPPLTMPPAGVTELITGRAPVRVLVRRRERARTE